MSIVCCILILGNANSMDLFESLSQSISKYKHRPAFCINGNYYSYYDLAEKTTAIRIKLSCHADNHGKGVGLVCNDDLETYAAIIAVWLEGRYYVPLNPQTPAERNVHMIGQAEIKIIVDSLGNTINFPDCISLEGNELISGEINLGPVLSSGETLAYTLFTSGSTGIPKGVPITRNNLSAFVESFFRIGLDTNENDRWLQMFDLSFDLSIFSFLVPLLQGACVYTIPKNQIRNNYIVKLLDDYHLTVALMTPSVIHFLTPYFIEIDNHSLRYSLFCGEALPVDVTEKWSLSVPFAQIINLYGPTEATIFCTCYPFDRHSPNKSKNGILSVGKPLGDLRAIVVDNKNQILDKDATGELCLSGAQITPGYLNSAGVDLSSFFEVNITNTRERFYKTGDLCSIDSDGDILFAGRLDSQIKVNGFRVELSEIEFHAKIFLTGVNLMALAYANKWGATEIGLMIESRELDTTFLLDYLKKKLPSYMIPSAIRFESVFPWNKNGKTDKKELLKRFLQK